MSYKIIDDFGTEVAVTSELKALVDAYVAAWVAMFGSNPKMQHPLMAMGLIIDFD